MMMRPAAFLSSTSSNDHRTNSHRRLRLAAGTYVDLGSLIGNAAAASSAPPLVTSQDDVAPASTTANADNNNNGNNSRSDRWIVLIDDEPSIRLAVGDYLHAVAGFDTVTAVDGPMAFLDACLWGCSWSLASPPAAATTTTSTGGDGEPSPPPWTAAGGHGREEGSTTTRRRSWRLPDCVISDVRMPGGIDGIKLLQLMRDRPPPSTTTPTTTTTTTIAHDESKQSPPGRRKRGRPKATTDVSYNYDGKDEYDLMATIIDGTEGSTRSSRIVTPADQAIQYMDAIHSCISYFLSSDETNGSSNVINNNGLLPRQVGKNDDDGPTSLGDIPVILLTAKAMISDRIMGYGAGANGYLPKPFRPEELLGMVDNLIRRQRENRQQQQQQRQQQRQQQQQQQQQYESNNYGGSNYQGRDILDGYLTPEQAREITNELIDIKKSIISSRTGSSSSSSSSIGGVSRIGTTFARGTEEEVVFMYQHLQSLLPRALWMYRTGERRKRIFTRDHIYSILVLCYNMDIITSLTTIKKKNVGWDVLFKELDDRYLECPEQCELVI